MSKISKIPLPIAIDAIQEQPTEILKEDDRKQKKRDEIGQEKIVQSRFLGLDILTILVRILPNKRNQASGERA